MLSRDDMHGYQERAAGFLLSNARAFCILGLGLGKTVSTLTAIKDLLDQCMIRKVLVIAPLRVGRHVWPQELSKWAHLSGLKMAVAIGTASARRKALQSDADIYVINRENVSKLVTDRRKGWPWDMVVIDESTSFKSVSASRFRAFRKVLPKIDRIALLTATPAPNSLLELWAQVFLLDSGKALGKTFGAFKTTFFESDYLGYSFQLRPGAKERIEGAVAPYTITMRTEDYLSLPDKICQTIPVELPPDAGRFYEELKKELVADIQGQEITAANAAVLCGKLQQAAQGAIYTESGFEKIHDAKLDALSGLIEEAGEPVIVAYIFRHDLARLKERFPEAVDVKESGAIDTWNAGKIRVLCCHPASAGHGLNLQHGGRHLIWFGQVWSGELDEQMIGRIYRQGQTRKVFVHRLIMSGTIDEQLMAVLSGKSMTQRSFVENILLKA